MVGSCDVKTSIFIQKQQTKIRHSCKKKTRTYGMCLQAGINVDGEESQKQTLSKERACTGKHDRKINTSPKSVKYILEIFSASDEFITFYVIYRFIKRRNKECIVVPGDTLYIPVRPKKFLFLSRNSARVALSRRRHQSSLIGRKPKSASLVSYQRS
jgi:hypothetical protein